MDTLKIEITPEVDRFQASQDEINVLVTIKAPFQDIIKRTPCDLVCCVDISGSMTPNMELLIQTLLFVVEQMSENDRLCVVTFSTDVRVLVPFTYMDGASKMAAVEACKSLGSENSTFLSGGLFMSCDEMLKAIIQDRVSSSSVFLLTDGEATDGMTSLSEIVSVLKNRKFTQNYTSLPTLPNNVPRAPCLFGYQRYTPNSAQNSSVTETVETDVDLPFRISTFGFGSTHNETLLRGIAQSGKGMYTYIQTHKTLTAAFADALGGLLSTTAQNINCKISCPDTFKIESVNGGQSVSETGNNFTTRFTDLQSEERRDLIVKLRRETTVAAPSTVSLIDVNVEYKNMLHTNATETVSCSYSVQFDTEEGLSKTPAQRSVEFDIQMMRLQVASALIEANRLAANDRMAACAHLRTYSTQVSDMIERNPSMQCKSLEADLNQAIDSIATQSHSVASKTMTSLSMQHYQQRSSTTSAMPSVYTTPHKTAVISSSQGHNGISQRSVSSPPNLTQKDEPDDV